MGSRKNEQGFVLRFRASFFGDETGSILQEWLLVVKPAGGISEPVQYVGELRRK